MFETLGQDAQRQRLHLGDSLGLVDGIAEHARQLGDLGDPSAILFAFELNLEGHMGTLAPGAFPIQSPGRKLAVKRSPADRLTSCWFLPNLLFATRPYPTIQLCCARVAA